MEWIAIVGEMKAATSSVHAALSRHPDVVGTEPKETEFWRYSRMNPRRYARMFLPDRIIPEQGQVLDGSVRATRSARDAQDFLNGCRRVGPPKCLVLVHRNEADRLKSFSAHLLQLEYWRSTEGQVPRAIEAGLAALNLKKTFGLISESLPKTKVVIVSFEALGSNFEDTIARLHKALGLAPGPKNAVWENTKSGQRRLYFPIRVLPGRARALRIVRQMLGKDRAAKLRLFLSGRGRIWDSNASLEQALDAAQPQISIIQKENLAFLKKLATNGNTEFVGFEDGP